MNYFELLDNSGNIIGCGCGEHSTIFQFCAEQNYVDISYHLSKKPQKPGYRYNLKKHNIEGGSYYDFEEIKIPNNELTNNDLKEMFEEEILNSIEIAEKPTAEKEGFHLVPRFNGTSIVWEYEADPSANPDEDVTLGTYTNPIMYELGMEVKVTKWYTDGDNIWEAIASGIPTDFNDSMYFDIINI